MKEMALRPLPGIRPPEMPQPQVSFENPKAAQLQVLREQVLDRKGDVNVADFAQQLFGIGDWRSFAQAFNEAIDRQDGFWRPWPLEGGGQKLGPIINRPPPPERPQALVEFDRGLIELVNGLDTQWQTIKQLLDDTTAVRAEVKTPGVIDSNEKERLKGLVLALEATLEAVPDVLLKRRADFKTKLANDKNNLPPKQIMGEIFERVNSKSNDKDIMQWNEGWGFASRIDEKEAKAFSKELRAMLDRGEINHDTAQAVVTECWLSAQGRTTPLFLGKSAVDTFNEMANKYQVKHPLTGDVLADFSQVAEIAKGHPIVMHYGIAIRDAINRGNLAELKALASEVGDALRDVGPDFLKNGAKPLTASAHMASAAVGFGPDAGSSALRTKFQEVGTAYQELLAKIAELGG
jgi:hypothetical protein